MSYKNDKRKGSRKTRVSFYISDNEEMLINVKMEMAGYKNKSEFIRNCAVYDKIYVTNFPDEKISEMTKQISKIGTNINQIAARVNSTQNFYRDDITYLLEAVNEIKKRQKEILVNLPRKER